MPQPHQELLNGGLPSPGREGREVRGPERAPPRTTQVKVCVIGDSGVGKTSLRNKYLTQKFSQSYKATIGCDFVTHLIPISEEENVSLAIWDTAGQERFASLSSAFFRSSDAAIFVYDATKPDTLASIRRWFGEFCDRCPLEGIESKRRFCFVVVGNKTDKIEGEGPGETDVKDEDVRALMESLVPPRPPPPPVDAPPPKPLAKSNSFSSGLASATSRLRTLSSTQNKRSSSPAPSSRSRTISLLPPTASSPTSHSNEVSSSSGCSSSGNTFTPTLYHTPSSSFFDTYGTHLMNDRDPHSPPPSTGSSPPRVASSIHSFNTARTSSSTSTVTFPSDPSSSSRLTRGLSPTSSQSHPHPRNRSLSAQRSLSTTPSTATLRPARTSLTSNASTSQAAPPPSPPPPPPAAPSEMPKLFFHVSAKSGEGVAEVFEYVSKRVAGRWAWEESEAGRGAWGGSLEEEEDEGRVALKGMGESRWKRIGGPCC